MTSFARSRRWSVTALALAAMLGATILAFTNAPMALAAPAPPSSAEVDLNGRAVIGQAGANLSIEVTDESGAIVSVAGATSDRRGDFYVQLTETFLNGELLSVRTLDANGVPSAPVTVWAPDFRPPSDPTDVAITRFGVELRCEITGRAELNTQILILDEAGYDIASGTTGADGSFSVLIEPCPPEVTLRVAASDSAGSQSDPSTVVTPIMPVDTTAPTVTAEVDQMTGATISGVTEPGATVDVRDATDRVIAAVAANDAGVWTHTFTTPQVAGEQFTVIARDAADNASEPVTATAPVIAPPGASDPPTTTPSVPPATPTPNTNGAQLPETGTEQGAGLFALGAVLLVGGALAAAGRRSRIGSSTQPAQCRA